MGEKGAKVRGEGRTYSGAVIRPNISCSNSLNVTSVEALELTVEVSTNCESGGAFKCARVGAGGCDNAGGVDTSVF